MIHGISGIVIHVSDQEHALEFYKEKLGFEIRFNMELPGGDRWIEVAPKNSKTTTISLSVPSQHSGNEWYEWGKNRIGKHTGIWFDTDDIQTTYQELKNKGVNISEPKREEWGGIMSEIRDPFNNGFTLIMTPKSE